MNEYSPILLQIYAKNMNIHAFLYKNLYSKDKYGAIRKISFSVKSWSTTIS